MVNLSTGSVHTHDVPAPKIVHYGRTFKWVGVYPKKKKYNSICKAINLDQEEVTYTLTKIDCPHCLHRIMEDKETELSTVKRRIIKVAKL